ncbi:MAG TPA: hypothetical protein VKU40_08010 [Thermoanaerobaculia bacterium]|nr:hypothetical protein [Thermoanaerobaculia bacterium]
MSIADNPKQRIHQIVEDQPDDSSYDEILQELAFARMIEKGIEQADAGQTMSHEEAKRRIARSSLTA